MIRGPRFPCAIFMIYYKREIISERAQVFSRDKAERLKSFACDR